jgi:hypothetical protein
MLTSSTSCGRYVTPASAGCFVPANSVPPSVQCCRAHRDLSVVLGHDDASAMRTLEVLLNDVLPAMPE